LTRKVLEGNIEINSSLPGEIKQMEGNPACPKNLAQVILSGLPSIIARSAWAISVSDRASTDLAPMPTVSYSFRLRMASSEHAIIDYDQDLGLQ
jgi:hypothetical protein